MSGGLSHETVAVLREQAKSRPRQPLFSNIIAAELFEAEYTRGPRKILPRSDGRYAIYDERRAVGERSASVHDRLAGAIAELGRSL